MITCLVLSLHDDFTTETCIYNVCHTQQGVQCRLALGVNVFVLIFFEYIFVCFVVAICDLVQDVEAKRDLP